MNHSLDPFSLFAALLTGPYLIAVVVVALIIIAANAVFLRWMLRQLRTDPADELDLANAGASNAIGDTPIRTTVGTPRNRSLRPRETASEPANAGQGSREEAGTSPRAYAGASIPAKQGNEASRAGTLASFEPLIPFSPESPASPVPAASMAAAPPEPAAPLVPVAAAPAGPFPLPALHTEGSKPIESKGEPGLSLPPLQPAPVSAGAVPALVLPELTPLASDTLQKDVKEATSNQIPATAPEGMLTMAPSPSAAEPVTPPAPSTPGLFLPPLISASEEAADKKPLVEVTEPAVTPALSLPVLETASPAAVKEPVKPVVTPALSLPALESTPPSPAEEESAKPAVRSRVFLPSSLAETAPTTPEPIKAPVAEVPAPVIEPPVEVIHPTAEPEKPVARVSEPAEVKPGLFQQIAQFLSPKEPEPPARQEPEEAPAKPAVTAEEDLALPLTPAHALVASPSQPSSKEAVKVEEPVAVTPPAPDLAEDTAHLTPVPVEPEPVLAELTPAPEPSAGDRERAKTEVAAVMDEITHHHGQTVHAEPDFGAAAESGQDVPAETEAVLRDSSLHDLPVQTAAPVAETVVSTPEPAPKSTLEPVIARMETPAPTEMVEPLPPMAAIVPPQPAAATVEVAPILTPRPYMTSTEHMTPTPANGRASAQITLGFEVTSLQLTPFFKLGAVQLRPLSNVVSLHLLTTQQAENPLAAGISFQIETVDLDESAHIRSILLKPLPQAQAAATPQPKLQVDNVQLGQGTEGAPIQVTSSQGTSTAVQLLATCTIAAMDFTPAFEIGSLRLEPNSNFVLLRSAPSQRPAALDLPPSFEVANVQLEGSAQIASVRLTPSAGK